ncbi:hypothetical protein [Streptomyces lonarensis]|uniref:Uncharacterized protein n=1 Tax=Streptomyces lonarensis TaxID=700599 RepID=A0A7X6HYL4_9ACTN|nr:hypothetical protein [Streptomyces lonarensis]NJQ05731.1 hypothetical protein [Streptomyces lonarensis]
MNQAARRIGRSLALVLPVVLVLSGTLAVANVPWAEPPVDSTVVNAGSERAPQQVEPAAEPLPAEDELLGSLIDELHASDPSTALTSLQREVELDPALAVHCMEIARALGQAAVEKYGSAVLAQEHARPVCDTSFASGVAGTV